ncbi:hypothetical protein [Bacillus sp. FSL K6-0067]|uniref:hypothetical protein n=1 Tax=Bacillus sp. FSL K6-0067 TaxID=2921412 RepID=UPI00077A9E9D|nr:hypothetical protein [Bacillus cereus]KXY34995.1 hypothetical protein AT267_21825 [Bacillus cereus]
MIKEEFEWEEIESHIKDNLTIAFVGPSYDERSSFFPEKFKSWKCKMIELSASNDSRSIEIKIIENNITIGKYKNDFITGIRQILKRVYTDFELVIMDLSSLQHSVLMYLSSVFISEYKPMKLFATYAEPLNYNKKANGDFALNEEYLGLRAVPGLARRSREKPIKLTTFLGFDGHRLIKILEETQQIKTVIPVIGFPSFQPNWQSKSLKNSMRVIEYTDSKDDVHKCGANSVFEALNLIERLKPKNDVTYALAPLGTRPHSLACAIYATRYTNTLLLYDHPIETSPRSNGILNCKCYHLTSLILP